MRRRGGVFSQHLGLGGSCRLAETVPFLRSFSAGIRGKKSHLTCCVCVFVCLCSCVTELLGVAARPAQSVVVSEELALLQGDLQQGRKLLLFLSLTCG